VIISLSKRQIANIAAQVEYKPGKYRQIANIAAQVEYKPGRYRQVANIAVHVEYVALQSQMDAQTYQSLEDALTPIKITLYTNPTAPIDSGLIWNYKTAIENAFGMTFTVDGGEDWVFISLHFARQGLEATATAFKKWVETQSQSVVDRYALFRRVYGSFQIQNISTVSEFPAEVVTGNVTVKTRPLGGQWYMTPNNTIHELGHLLDGKAGFGAKKLGSIEYTVDDSVKGGGNPLHNNYSRAGMGEGKQYLRNSHLLHSSITNVNGVATFIAQTNPYNNEPEYNAFVPWRYLFYDIAQLNYSVWASPVYSSRYGLTGRIDTLVQNATTSAVETAADGFLNWVRNSFGDLSAENNAQKWRNFFNQNIGMFLRNAVIYTYGMVQFYLEQEIITPPLFSAAKNQSRSIRLYPEDNDNNLLGNTDTYLDSTIDIYGLLPVPEGLGEGSEYWLLVSDNRERLVWVASQAIDMTNPQLHEKLNVHGAVASSLANYIVANRAYQTTDLNVIIGEN